MLDPIDTAEAATWRTRTTGPPESAIRPMSKVLAATMPMVARLPAGIRGYVRAAIVRPGRGDVRLKTSFGELASPRRDHMFLKRQVVAEPLETALLVRLLAPGDTFVDVGANRGWFTLTAAHAVGPTGRVIAIEPDDRVGRILSRNVEVNPELAPRIEVWPVAIGPEDGVARFVQEAESELSHVLGASDDEVPTVEVKMRAIDSLLEEARATPDVVKIDIEGYEAEVIIGLLRLQARPAIVFEAISENLARARHTLDELLGFLAADYRTFSICWDHGNLEPVEGPRCDAGRNMLALPAERADQILATLIEPPAAAG